MAEKLSTHYIILTSVCFDEWDIVPICTFTFRNIILLPSYNCQFITAFSQNIMIIIIPHIIKNQFYWLKDNHMT